MTSVAKCTQKTKQPGNQAYTSCIIIAEHNEPQQAIEQAKIESDKKDCSYIEVIIHEKGEYTKIIYFDKGR